MEELRTHFPVLFKARNIQPRMFYLGVGRTGKWMAYLHIQPFGWITLTKGRDRKLYIRTNKRVYPGTEEPRKYDDIIHAVRAGAAPDQDAQWIERMLNLDATGLTVMQCRAFAQWVGILLAENCRHPGAIDFALWSLRQALAEGHTLTQWKESFCFAKTTNQGKKKARLLQAARINTIENQAVTHFMVKQVGGHATLPVVSHLLRYATPQPEKVLDGSPSREQVPFFKQVSQAELMQASAGLRRALFIGVDV